jgi:hypothetical protein
MGDPRQPNLDLQKTLKLETEAKESLPQPDCSRLGWAEISQLRPRLRTKSSVDDDCGFGTPGHFIREVTLLV